MSIHEDWADPSAPRPGMSLAVKILVIVGAAGGFLMLLCCGGGAFLFFKARDAIEQIALTTDPDEIRSRLAGIVQIDVPPEFEPSRGFEMGVVRWAGFEKSPRDGSRLLLMEIDREAVHGQSLAEQRRTLEQVFDQPGTPFARFEMPITVTERSTRALTVCGEPVDFEFNRGIAADGQAIRQAVGAFRTPAGAAVLNLIVPDEAYDEEAVVKLIESIRDPVVPVEVDEDEPDEMPGDGAKPAIAEAPGDEKPAEQAPPAEDD